jgi:hypothetical protein
MLGCAGILARGEVHRVHPIHNLLQLGIDLRIRVAGALLQAEVSEVTGVGGPRLPRYRV